MGDRDHDREHEYSPNPPFSIGQGDGKHPEAVRAAAYDHHRRAGTLGDYYEAYPADRPWHYGLTPQEREAAERGGGRER